MTPHHSNETAVRPATEADLPELAALDAAHTKHAVGSAQRTENEIRIEWKAPTFHPETDTRVVLNRAGRIIGWCEVYDFPPHTRLKSRLRVHPRLEQPQVIRQLVAWAIERARNAVRKAPEGERVILTQGSYRSTTPHTDCLLSAGFSYVRSFLRMRIEMRERPMPPEWPNGFSMRPLVPGQDDRAAVRAVRDAFRDHWGFVETPFEEDLEEWKQWIHEDEDFDTDLWFLAFDGDEIAGFCQCYPSVGDDPRIGLVDELGVRRPWRGKGLATALLRHAFRTFYDRGKPIVELGVDAESPTGATRLYEKAGMSPVWTDNVYELELRPGSL